MNTVEKLLERLIYERILGAIYQAKVEEHEGTEDSPIELASVKASDAIRTFKQLGFVFSLNVSADSPINVQKP